MTEGPTQSASSSGEQPKPRRRKILVYVAFGTSAVTWGSLFGNLGPERWVAAGVISFIASVFLGWAAMIELRNHHYPKWKYSSVGAIIIVFAFVSLVCVIWTRISAANRERELVAQNTSLSNQVSQLREQNTSLSNQVLQLREQIQGFENVSLGAFTPNIWVFLYQSNKLVCPRPDKVFPGDNFDLVMVSQIGLGPGLTLALIVLNTNSYPIYDLKVTVSDETPNPDNSKIITNALGVIDTTTLFYPSEHKIWTYDFDPAVTTKVFTFHVNTKRANTMHKIALVRVNNEWEYGCSSIDYTHQRLHFWYFSSNFPRDQNGHPGIPATATAK